MKLGETSILELLLWPIGNTKIVRDYWGNNLRQPANYEHVYGPLVLCAFIRFIPFNFIKWFLFSIIVVFHVLIKEVYFDWIRDHKPFNWPNIIERSYGCLLGGIALL